MGAFSDKFDDEMDEHEAKSWQSKLNPEPQAEITSGPPDDLTEQHEFDEDDLKRATEDPEAFFSEYPQELLKLSLQDLATLSKEAEFDFVKQAAKLGHKEAQQMVAMKASVAETLGVPVVVVDEKTGAETTLVSQEDVDAAQGQPELPGLGWYDSKSHGKRRYYAGAKGKGGSVLWTYDKAQAVEVGNIDHAFLVRKLCIVGGYKKIAFNKPENC